jgi:sirohydrochlorin cobaltochelatase
VAYLEAMKPTLAEAVDELVEEGAPAITVFPLFMAQGGHLRHDVPVLLEGLRAKHPRVPISLEAAIGDVPEILQAICAWILSRAVD